MKNIGSFDVIVAGGGTAGAAAAITAGQLGLTVLVIEAQSYLGGTSTGGLVTPMMGNHLPSGIPLNTGITSELLEELKSRGQADGYIFNPIAMRHLLEHKAVDAGVEILYESILTQVVLKRSKVDGVHIATRRGVFCANCTTLIDATGDAQASALAGVELQQGREGSSEHQPMSLRFVMGGLDLKSFRKSMLEKGGQQALHFDKQRIISGKCAFLKEYAEHADWPDKWLTNFGIQFFQVPSRPNELWFNCPRLSGYDPLAPQDISKAYIEGRQYIDAYIDIFRKNIKGAENAFLLMEAPQIGIREGRRIVGKYVLTADDFLNARKFEDGICFNRYPIDIHRQNATGVELVEMKQNTWHEIPFRCLIPEEVQSLVVAGRCISSDFAAQASYRIIPNCHTLGQAAAVAALLAKQNHCDVSKVQGAHVRDFMITNSMLPSLDVDTEQTSHSPIH